MYLCLCADVTIDEFKKCYKKHNGDIKNVIDELQVTQGCGSCMETVVNLINTPNNTKTNLNGD